MRDTEIEAKHWRQVLVGEIRYTERMLKADARVGFPIAATKAKLQTLKNLLKEVRRRARTEKKVREG